MKKIPNILSVLRIVFAPLLMLVEPLSREFFVIYAVCGISDVLDGYLARRNGWESPLGSALDSIGDTLFFIFLFIGMLPVLELGIPMLLWAVGIFALKTVTLAIGAVRFSKLAFIHTFLNKLTGFAIFLFPVFFLILGRAWTTGLLFSLASCASVEELCMIILAPTYDPDARGILQVMKRNT